MAVPRGPRLLSSAPFTQYRYVVTNRSLGSSMSKHAFDMQEIMAPVLNKDIIWLLLTLTAKLAAYLLLLSLTFIILCSWDRHPESEAEPTLLSELSISLLSGVSSVLVCVSLGEQVSEVFLFTSSLRWWGLCLCLSEWDVLLYFDNSHWY